MTLRVYVAAPYGRSATVRAVHNRLRASGIEPTSAWADTSFDGEPPRDVSRAAAERDDMDVARAHALLVLGYPGEGGEMFAEVGRALVWGIPIVWVGRKILSAHRDGVQIVADIDAGVHRLSEVATGIEKPWLVEDQWVRRTLWEAFDAAAKTATEAA